MPRGPSGRIVFEIDAGLKKELHAAVALEGRSLKDWFMETARAYVTSHGVRANYEASERTTSPSARKGSGR